MTQEKQQPKEIHALGSEILATQTMDGQTTDEFQSHELCWQLKNMYGLLLVDLLGHVELVPAQICPWANWFKFYIFVRISNY